MKLIGVFISSILLYATMSYSADDPLAAIDQLLQQQPQHQGALYYGARSAARRGQLGRALSYLQKLEQSGFDDALERNDFPNLHDNAEFVALANRLQLKANVSGNAQLFVETQCADLLPEGTAYDSRRKELLISSGHQRNVFAIARDGNCRKLVHDDNSGLLAVLGMQVDEKTDTLWVANTHAPFMKHYNDSTAGHSQLSQIDLASGKVIAHYALPPNGLANDLTLRPNGDILLTESISGAIYQWQAKSKSLDLLLPMNSFEGPNGIVSLENGDAVVADFNGLYLLQWAQSIKPTVTLLQTVDHRYLGGIDGIARDGNIFVAIQNLVGRGRVWSFEIDPQAKQIKHLQLRLRNHADLFNPTTGVIANGQFYFVADPEWQQNNTPQLKAMPQGRRGHRILQLPIQ